MKNADQKSKLFALLRILAFALLTALILYVSARVLERNNAYAKYHDFFENKDSIDVLLLGNSHVVNGLNPLILYRETGYTAYNMGCHAGTLPVSYWTLMNALDYCTPSLVVVDTNLLYADDPHLDLAKDGTVITENNTLQQLHLNMDVFPYSATKREAVRDLVSDPKKRLQFLLPFSIYHNRRNDLGRDDFLHPAKQDGYNRLMGAEMREGVVRHLSHVTYDLSLPDDYETVGTAYLRKLLDVCHEKNIRVVVTYLPFHGMSEDVADTRAAHRIADEYGAPFLNFMDPALQEAAEIDFRTDLTDTGHLNRIGAEKVTVFLASFLSSLGETGLSDHRGDASYDAWETRLADYVAETEASLTEIEDPCYQLYTLMYHRIRAVVYLRPGSAFLRDPDMTYLLSKMSGTGRIHEAVVANESYLMLYDVNTHPFEAVGQESFEDKMTFLGGTTLVSSGDFRNLYTNGIFENNLLDMNRNFGADLQLILFDPDVRKQFYYVAPGEIVLNAE